MKRRVAFLRGDKDLRLERMATRDLVSLFLLSDGRTGSRRGRTKQSGALAFLTCIVNEPRKSIHSLAGRGGEGIGRRGSLSRLSIAIFYSHRPTICLPEALVLLSRLSINTRPSRGGKEKKRKRKWTRSFNEIDRDTSPPFEIHPYSIFIFLSLKDASLVYVPLSVAYISSFPRYRHRKCRLANCKSIIHKRTTRYSSPGARIAALTLARILPVSENGDSDGRYERRTRGIEGTRVGTIHRFVLLEKRREGRTGCLRRICYFLSKTIAPVDPFRENSIDRGVY